MQPSSTNRLRYKTSYEFLMTCICLTAGLGNIWRFPIAAYNNGGGAFLVVYMIMLVVIGTPLYFLELSLGQFGGQSNIRMYSSLARGYTGIGATQIIASACVSTYYAPITAIALFYLSRSINTKLPWDTCEKEWGDICIDAASQNRGNETQTYSSAELYYEWKILNEVDDLFNGPGSPDLELSFWLLSCWIVVSMVLILRLKVTGKYLHLLALYPFIVFFIMAGICISLRGSDTGIIHFFVPDWSSMLKLTVWFEALVQCFFSLGLGFGAIVLYASYGKFTSDSQMVAVLVIIVNACTCLLSGFIVFASIGNMCYITNMDVSFGLKTGGIGKAFISYSSAVAHITVAPYVMSFVFFATVTLQGITNIICIQNTIIAQILDILPNIQEWHAVTATSILGFLLGLIYITRGGMFIVKLADTFCVPSLIIFIVTLEVLCVVFGYGLQRICWDIQFMTRNRVSVIWRFSWGVTLPVLLIVVAIIHLCQYRIPSYRRINFPTSYIICAWSLLLAALLLVMWFPLRLAIKYRKYRCYQIWRLILSNDEWGPADEATREPWIIYTDEQMSREAECKESRFKRFCRAVLDK